MFKQFRFRAGAALAVMTLIFGAPLRSADSAELADFEGAWDLYISARIQTGEETQPLVDVPGRLVLEREGVTMGGTLTLIGSDAEASIPIEGATLEGDRLNLEINFSDSGGDSSFDSVMKPILGELSVDASKGVKFSGSLEIEDGEMSGRIDAEGLSQPGVIDGLFLEIFGSPEEIMEEAPEVSATVTEDDESASTSESVVSVTQTGGDESASVSVSVSSDEPEASMAEVDGEDELDFEDPEVIDLGPRAQDETLHAGSDAEVSALEADDLADEEAAVQLSAARAIAERERQRRELAEAQRKLERVHTFQFELTGDSRADVVADASIRALMVTASRLYYGNYVLLGRDLLEPYLRTNGGKFIVHAKILGEQAVGDGQRRVQVEVAVDTDGLYNDLDSKHFIAEPNFRPVTTVALAESLNDQPNSVPLARVTLQELLKQADMRVETQVLGQDLDSKDLSSDPSLLRQGRLESQRLNADLLVTGVTRLYGPQSKVILYDQFYEVSGTLSLKFIRTDNGEVLKTYEGSYTAKATSPEDAVEDCFVNLAAKALSVMTDDFLIEWQNTMLDKTEYRFCITGADAKTIDVLGNELMALSGDAQLYLKSYYADVAVLNANLPGAKREDVEKFLRLHREPQFKLIPTERGHYELKVL